MPVYVTCKRCGAKIYLNVKRKNHLPPVFRLKCPQCRYEDIYTRGDAVEEDIYTFTCPVCRRKFFISRKPPVTVECPHCRSILHITSADKEPEVVKTSTNLLSPTVITTALLGATFGALTSKNRFGGAIIGGLVGALVGVLVDALSEPEAKYIEEY